MSTLYRVALALLSAVVVAAATSPAQAEMPPHLVIVRPTATHHMSPHSPAVRLPAEPYPYGYFGATTPWPRWQRQTGINRTFTQWGQR